MQIRSSKLKGLLKFLVAAPLGAAMCFAAACTPADDTTPPDDGGGTVNPPSETVEPVKEGTYGGNATVSGYTDANGKFFSDYKTLKDAHEAGKRLNIRLAEEGMVLMKNENNALPLNREERNVTLFGIKSVSIQTGGGGSGNGYTGSSDNASYSIDPTTLVGSMQAAGFNVNQKVLDLYEANIADMSYIEYSESSGSSQTLTRELPVSYYNSMITSTYGAYNDAAIITFSRSGAEGLDHIAHEDSHVLQLTEDEKALVKHVKQHFNKVIVLINTGNNIEIDELAQPKTADNLGVDAILYVGHVGNDGAYAIGEILNGTVNPSGHTVDLWSTDFTKDPSYTNFGDMGQNGEGFDNSIYFNGEATMYNSVEYREDIYVGYRYYETVAADMNKEEAGSGDEWYDENVVYPFGHGLSYTTFDWKITDDIAKEAAIPAANSTVTIKVQVTNTGAVAGKDVVQVYATTPYEKGGIEKAERVLVGYAKTDLLEPGESQAVTVQFVAQDMASFDWDDKNGNGFQGYELEAGDYIISVCEDSHTVVSSVKRTIAEDITCPTDLDTGNPITAVFSQTEGPYAMYNTTNEALLDNLISRADGLTLPAPSTKEDRTVTQAWMDMMESYDSYDPSADDAGSDIWKVNSVPSTWKQAASHSADYSDVILKIGDMSGVSYQLPTLENGVLTMGSDDDSKTWEQFLNQLTWEELLQIASQGSYGRPSVASIDLKFQLDIDGPSQIAWYGNRQADTYYGGISAEEKEQISQTATGMGTFWVGAVLIGSTWNEELAEEQGVMVGNESILTNSPGWYGPGCNMHRSPFGGRNFEYYSEDPLLAGTICGSVVRGATSKGTICYVKHMFLNDQETDRAGINTYVTEQAIREIYLKPYEYIIKEGRSLGTMGGGNRIGDVRIYDCDALYNGILRDEWDFRGMNITDSVAGGGHPDMDRMLRAGLDCPLGAGTPTASRPAALPNDLTAGVYNAQTNMVEINGAASPTQWYTVRNAAMHVLYATANSNGIDNAIGSQTKPVTLEGGVETSVNLINPADINAVALTDVVEVKDEDGKSALPDGMTLSDTGILSGTPTRAGTYNITVTASADGWVPVTLNVTVTVTGKINYSGNLTVAAGAAVSGTFTNELYKVGVTELQFVTTGFSGSGVVNSVTYAAEGLPEGLTLNADGTLSGSVATAGTYTFTVTVTASALIDVYGMMQIPVSSTFTQTFTITVS